jgi:hypothetical protein
VSGALNPDHEALGTLVTVELNPRDIERVVRELMGMFSGAVMLELHPELLREGYGHMRFRPVGEVAAPDPLTVPVRLEPLYDTVSSVPGGRALAEEYVAAVRARAGGGLSDG